MSGAVYAITPNLGLALNMTWGPNSGGPSPPGTGPQFPTDIMQYGMQPGKVVRGSNALRYILCTNGATQLAANAVVNITMTPPFLIGGTGGQAGNTVVAVPANALCWCSIGV